MKERYIKPQMETALIQLESVLCLSLTGGTEPMSQGDLEDLIIDDPFTL